MGSPGCPAVGGMWGGQYHPKLKTVYENLVRPKTESEVKGGSYVLGKQENRRIGCRFRYRR